MQTVKLNLIPGSVLPVVNVSQYDEKRQFALQVYEGATAYSLSGKSVQIRGTKPDGNGFAYDTTDGVVSVSGNTVTISTTQQMTAVGGQTMAELRITSGDTILGTLNFILMVEPSALSDDTPISDTDIPAIERDFEAALAEAEADALKAEGYAVGTQEGVPAQSGEPYYQDNAKYYKEQAEAAASGGGADALKAEGYAVGTQNGVPVTSGSPYYHNNAAYYEGEASTSATNAGNSETAAAGSASAASADALKSEGFAVGEQGGQPVGPTSPYYQNNAAYYAAQAGQYATGGLIFKGSVAFANIPTTGMVNGDMYNITDDFTTDSRFIEGAGVEVKAGADIAYVAGSVNKWDILALGGGGGVPAGGTTDQVLAKNSNADGDTKWMDVVLPDELTDELRDAEVIEGKNLWKPAPTLATTTSANVTYTPTYDTNGLISYLHMQGTANSRSSIIYTTYETDMRLSAGTYYMVLPSSITGVNIKYNASGTETVIATVTSSNPSFTISSAAANKPLQIEIVIASGTVVSDTKLYPMISTSPWSSAGEYEPYYVPVKERKLDIADEQVLGAWNLLNNTAVSQVISPVTFTVNDDKTVSISGTTGASDYKSLNLTDTMYLEAGKPYYLSGCPVDGGYSGHWRYTLQLVKTNNQEPTYAYGHGLDAGSGSGAFALTESGYYRIRINTYPNQTYSGQKFYPMVALKPNMPYVPYAMTNRELTEVIYSTSVAGVSGLCSIKCGNVVTLVLENVSSTSMKSATLPTELRSRKAMSFTVIARNGTYFYLCNFSINTNGTMALYYSPGAGQARAEVPDGWQILGTFTYVVYQ